MRAKKKTNEKSMAPLQELATLRAKLEEAIADSSDGLDPDTVFAHIERRITECAAKKQ